MRKLFFVIPCTLLSLCSHAQSADSIISVLTAINHSITNGVYANGHGDVISKRAMNIFLANKVGYYMSQYGDLSFYKNNITFNAAEGIFSLNHNLFQAKGNDEPVRSFMVVGARANITDAFAAAFSNRQFSNEMGATL